MTCFVQKDNEMKEIQTEDLAYFIYKGYKKIAKSAVKEDVVEPVKKGRKRSFTEDYKDEE